MTKIPKDSEAGRFIRALPSRPDMEKQRKLAKALVRDCLGGDAEAQAMFQHLHPNPPAPGEIRLSDAQLVIARSYGISSWPKLKQKIDRLTKSAADLFVDCVGQGDVAALEKLFDAHPDLIARLNDPLFAFGQRAVHVTTGNLDMLDRLLKAGVNINLKSEWEHGGFGILELVAPDQAGHLIERGAAIDIWAAARLDMLESLKALLAADLTLVHARGGDGKRALHYAASVEIAECLLDAGAELDALDDDHSSTAAQYLVGDNKNVCRYLIERGAKSDLLMAVALGDSGLVERHLETDPASIGMRVSQEWFPMIDTAKNGGHIYQWTLGFYLSAFDIARKHGHDAVLDILLRHAPAAERLMAAVWRGDRSAIDALLAAEPELVSNGNQLMHRQLADAARHNDIDAVRTMLSVGFPTDATGQHQATPLHFACFHGNRQMVAELLARKASITARDRDFGSTPLGWAVHGSMNGWPGTSSENHDDVVGLLLDAGAEFDPDIFPTGHDAIDSVLKSRLFPT